MQEVTGSEIAKDVDMRAEYFLRESQIKLFRRALLPAGDVQCNCKVNIA